MLRAIRQDSERTSFLGINVRRMQLLSFTISGAVASFAGALQAPWVQIVTPESAGYVVSTQPMLATLLGGASFFWGPVVGSFLFSLIELGTRSLAGLSELVTGSILLLIVLCAPDGVLGLVSRLRTVRTAESPLPQAAGWRHHERCGRSARLAQKLWRDSGAARRELRLERGKTLAIIGPNGAGKTTLFRSLTGETKVNAGTILINGVDMTHTSIEAHVRAGIGRTFQVARIYPESTVRDNMVVAIEARRRFRGQRPAHVRLNSWPGTASCWWRTGGMVTCHMSCQGSRITTLFVGPVEGKLKLIRPCLHVRLVKWKENPVTISTRVI